jgi:predicted neutral ceramidase superfamily lipid hydrolase
VATLAGLAQLEHGTAGHHFATVTDEGFQQVLEVEHARAAVDQRNDVDAEHACSWVWA